ncbi:MAG TPA: MOSC domain-containing protein [Stellaceae bacterium]|nr:MOSC domain-containing protein [Stellaceae bacterium]
MGAAITDIYRYPVKGLSPERLDRVSLAPRECLPQDRRFAIALGSTVFDPHEPKWLPKTQFIMLMRDEKLAQLQTAFDPDSEILTVAQNGAVLLRERITREDGARRIAAFYADFLGDPTKGMLRVVEAPGHAFADARRKPNATTDKYVSLINRGSIRALEAAIGAPVDPLRFRANVYFDGAAPWSELDWLGRDIALGEVRLHGISAITRCAATEVNPTTAQRDLEIVAGLQRHFSHNLMGIYAEVVTGGDIALGDTVAAP